MTYGEDLEEVEEPREQEPAGLLAWLHEQTPEPPVSLGTFTGEPLFPARGGHVVTVYTEIDSAGHRWCYTVRANGQTRIDVWDR